MDTNKKQIWIKRLGRRKMIVVLVITAVLVLAGGAVVAVTILHRNQDETAARDPNESKKIAQQTAQSKRNGQTRDDATKEVETGNTQKVDQIYATAIQSETDTTQKIKLSIDQSEVLFNAGKFDEAVAAAEKGGQLSTDKYLTADWLSRIYEQQGDFKQSAAYYTLAGQWATSPTNVSGFDKAYYDTAAREMMNKAKLAGQL